MWNYAFMFPSMLILATLLCFYFARPRLPIRMNQTYLGMLVLELLIIAADIVSSKADENYQMFTPALLYVLNTAFFVLYLARIYWFFRFSMDVLRLNAKKPLKWLLMAPFLICELIAVSSFATGAVFRIENGMYQSGPLYGILYYCFLFYIFASLALLLIYRSRLRPHELGGSLAYNMMLLAGTVMRRLLPKLLVMNTFSLTALLIIYLTFENPDLYMSERGHSFSMRGFTALLNEITPRRDYHILAFVLKNYQHERGMLGGAQMDRGISQIGLYLRRTFPDCMPFYLRSGRFTLVGSDSLNWEMIREEIDDRFQQQWVTETGTLYLSVGFADIKPVPRLDGADRIISNIGIALESVGGADPTAPHNLVSSESLRQLDEQVDILRSLEHAVKNNDVEVFLQPVFSSETRTMVAAEALARIRDDTGRIIPPGLFIPIAEKNGYINRLGEIVFEKTCAFIHDHDMSTLNLSWVNVNLSPIQCMQRDLAKRLTGILNRYGVAAEKLHLEITEQSMIDYSLLERQITELRDSGFLFVLDDYGSGYSNLTRVKHYPFINIKLDMEVVWDYFRERDSLLPTIVQGFRQMGLSITAEGIETREMADVLVAIGCDYLQGYLFDKPLPLDEFIDKYGRKDAAPTSKEA